MLSHNNEQTMDLVFYTHKKKKYSPDIIKIGFVCSNEWNH